MANRLQRRRLTTNTRRKHLLKKLHTRIVNRRKMFANLAMEDENLVTN
ncbi:hypothetical protein HR060_01395 [Catenovulum sp. SM1970]|nr:hypothetical protein [Marinifaba aquimaris]NTS75507.1 hypothetical protein [Marinifaba aquimaris]